MLKPGFCKLDKPCYVILAVIALLIVQEFAGKAGGAIADLFSYEKFDPDNIFARQSVHHLILLLVGLAVVAVLSRLLKDNFGFQCGDRQKGMRYLIIFTAALTMISLIYHILMYTHSQPLTYDFALNQRNVLGTLGFQLLLSGTAEEILYRALPVTVLIHILGKSVKLKWSITLEVLLASLLFSIAHIKWTLYPFAADANVSQLFYAFAIGTVQGMAYQESRSVLYPILMHSMSNVLMVGTGYMFAVLM
ncbi:MAG TPA: CPBP family intramembrane glutamic endopeptidase [Syntrophomonas sp.]|nr:CPBP family intramembrane glutamic endopeptidase [Syntrophomonas sp.]